MDETEWQKRLLAGISLRKRTAMETARDFVKVGISMSRPELDEKTRDAVHAVGLLLLGTKDFLPRSRETSWTYV
jgi:hypothetical protein